MCQQRKLEWKTKGRFIRLFISWSPLARFWVLCILHCFARQDERHTQILTNHNFCSPLNNSNNQTENVEKWNARANIRNKFSQLCTPTEQDEDEDEERNKLEMMIKVD